MHTRSRRDRHTDRDIQAETGSRTETDKETDIHTDGQINRNVQTRKQRETDRQTEVETRDRESKSLFVCWLLNVPATCECISGTDLLRQFYVLPH